ncbi:hypothetical protein [Francisella salina]|uniref:Uncharacterized protein n=1 Tax=Francisella salina TaxID=573569 RepID=A0ABM5M9Z8_FRAST|nr:hypothetical protein [Francisella salina]AEI36089.1 hypothetical protein F7308_1163 [Francisella salina]
MKNAVLAFLGFFLLQSSQAYIVKIVKDNHVSQPGYIATIKEKNTQTANVNKDGTELFSVFRPYGSYCLNITKLAASINNANSFTSCFDNQYIVGNKVKKIILTDNGKAFYTLSDSAILGYTINKNKNIVGPKFYTQKYPQQIIDAKLVDKEKYFYLVTASYTNESGKLFVYEVNPVGTLKKIKIIPLSFKPKKIIFDDSNDVYIQSDKSIYNYNLMSDGKIKKQEEIITIPSGEIIDFSVLNENSTESKVILATQDNESGEQGIVEVYKVFNGSSRLLYQEKYDDIPQAIAPYIDKGSSHGKVLIAFDHKYIVANLNNTYFEDVDEYKIDGSFLKLLQHDNLVEAIFSGSVVTYDLRQNSLLSELFLKDINENSSFISKDFIGFGDENNINISQI